MRLLSRSTNGEWVQFDDRTVENDRVERGARSVARNLFIDILTASNLVVLTGLGTSLCINRDADVRGLPRAPTMTDLWTEAQLSLGANFDKLLDIVGYHPEKNAENLEILLSRCKIALEYLEDESANWNAVKAFAEKAELIIRQKCAFVSRDTPLTNHEVFLQRIGKRSSRKARTKIFTTNYDLCFEEAARRRRFVVVDGFSPHHPPTYDPLYFQLDFVRRDKSSDSPDYIESVIHLYKLHGSIDWKAEGGDVVKDGKAEKPLLIYPRSSKYEQAFEPPYLDMMSAFQNILRQPDTALLVIGFGFRDDHLARPIMSALNANPTLKVIVCDPGFFPDADDNDEHRLCSVVLLNSYHRKLASLIAQEDPRVALIRGRFEEIVREIPDLTAESDRERHAERFRKLRDYERDTP